MNWPRRHRGHREPVENVHLHLVAAAFCLPAAGGRRAPFPPFAFVAAGLQPASWVRPFLHLSSRAQRGTCFFFSSLLCSSISLSPSSHLPCLPRASRGAQSKAVTRGIPLHLGPLLFRGSELSVYPEPRRAPTSEFSVIWTLAPEASISGGNSGSVLFKSSIASQILIRGSRLRRPQVGHGKGAKKLPLYMASRRS